jgi:hypothetical protein
MAVKVALRFTLLCDSLGTLTVHSRSLTVASANQQSAARRNVKKAAAAKSKKTISHLSKATRTALGKQGAKVAKEHRA